MDDKQLLILGIILAGEATIIGVLLWLALKPGTRMTLIGRDDAGRITEIIERGA